MTAEEMRRAYVGFGTMWFQSSHITSHMTEKKLTERVTETRGKQRGEQERADTKTNSSSTSNTLRIYILGFHAKKIK